MKSNPEVEEDRAAERVEDASDRSSHGLHMTRAKL
jgi:hypothetical protein